jgi:hypothetical protein
VLIPYANNVPNAIADLFGPIMPRSDGIAAIIKIDLHW